MRPVGGVRILAVLVGGCAVYDSSLLVDGGADVAVTDAGADVDPCHHAYPPPRPAADDPSDASDLQFVAAFSSIDFGEDGGALGFDLDHTCTCPGPESCVPQSTSTSKHCDDDAGRDNSGGQLIQLMEALSPSLSTAKANDNIARGSVSLLVRVRNWNGQPNDTQIALAVFTSNGTIPEDDAGVHPIPAWDGGDTWSVDPTSVQGTPPPWVAVNEDPAAYVSNGFVVASVPFGFGIGASFGPDFLLLNEAILAGKMTITPAGVSLSGVVTGRWDTRNLLTGLQGLHDPFNSGQFLCGSDSTYQQFKGLICGASDIARQASSDHTGAPCDALSLAVGFTASSAKLGGLLSGNPASYPCGTGYSDSCGP